MKILFITIAFCVVSFSVAAQSEVETTLREVEANSATLRALREQAEARKLGNKTGIYLANPEVEYSYLWGSPSAVGNRTDVSVRQSFDFPTAYAHRSKIADMENANAELAYRTERMALLLEAKQACIALIYYNALARECAARLRSAAQLAEMYRARLAKGDANAIESNKAQLNLVAVQHEADRIAAEQASLRLELKRLNGGKELTLSAAEYPETSLPNSFESWYAQAESVNPYLQHVGGQLDVSRQQVKLNAALGLPKFSAGYTSEKVVGEWFQGVSAGVSIPLWENKNRVKLAKAQVRASEAALSDAKIQLYNTLQSLYRRAAALRQTAAAYRSTLAACNNEPLLQKAFAAGEISLLTYLQEMDYYYAAVSSVLAAERDFELAAAELTAAES
ncbi:MAG: TolC family protein [Prevotellaceae bacterium]|jgi:outer membrane protein TolC|nr:TolC family protein [Prevotellaceae bacterium]